MLAEVDEVGNLKPAATRLSSTAVAGALVVGSLSLLSLGVLPILLGWLEEAGKLSKAGIGQAAMLELFGLALGATIGGYWMGRGAMRLKTGATALGLAAINIATAYAVAELVVLLDRAIAGLLAGLLYGAGNAIIVRSKNPDRLTGILVGGSMVPSIALAYLIPVFLIPRFGGGAGFYALGASGLVAALFAMSLVDTVSRLERPKRGRLNGPLVLFGGAIVLQSCGLGAGWTYIERLANQHGFSPSVVGLAVAGSLASQVAAAWLSAWIVPKVARWPALFVLVVAQAGFVVLAILTSSSATFIAAVCIFGSAASAMQAFQVAEVIALDPTRRTAVLVSPLILFGNGLGPLIASFATMQGGIHGGMWAAVVLTAGAAILYFAAASRLARPS